MNFEKNNSKKNFNSPEVDNSSNYDVTNFQEANELLEKETDVNSSILTKIANNKFLRKAFYTVALFVGLLDANKAFSQERVKGDNGVTTENVIKPDNQKEEKSFNLDVFLEDSQEYIKSNEYFSKYPNSLMSLLASVERPSDYQAEQIVELHDSIVNLVKKRKFDNDIDLLAYINSNLDSSFSSQQVSLNLKDAFPEKENEKSKGTFDCDSRTVMVSSILQTLGYSSKDITIYETEGHMFMYAVKEDAYFELTTNKEIKLSKDKQAQMDKIDNLTKYFAYLLSNRGTALALEGNGNIFSYPNKDKTMKSIEILEKAVELDGNNLTAKLNLIKLLSDQYQSPDQAKEAAELYKEVLASLVYRYNGVEKNNMESEYKPSINMGGNGEIAESTKENELSLQALSAKTVQESEYVKKKFQEYADLSCYNFKNYSEAINMYKFLLKNTKNNKENETNINNYKLQILHSEFQNHDFTTYINDYNKFVEELRQSDDEKYFDHNLQVLAEQKLVARIISGQEVITKENVKEFIRLYESSPIFSCLTSEEGSHPSSYLEAIEALKHWQGYESLKNLIESNK